MKKILLFYIFSVLFTQPALGLTWNNKKRDCLQVIDTISYELQVEKWVTTDTAKINLLVDTATKEDFGIVQQRILKKLATLVTKDAPPWRIDNFTMNQDPSGLDSMSWNFSVRLPLRVINELKRKVTGLSRPGEQYRIQQIDFQPSLEQKEEVLEELRQKTYSQVQSMLKKIKSQFPYEHYFLHKLNFISPLNQPLFRASSTVIDKTPTLFATGSNLILTSQVEFASARPA